MTDETVPAELTTEYYYVRYPFLRKLEKDHLAQMLVMVNTMQKEPALLSNMLTAFHIIL